MVSRAGMRSGIDDHDASNALARTLASLREWRRRDTVRPPREKARSASVDVAVNWGISRSFDSEEMKITYQE